MFCQDTKVDQNTSRVSSKNMSSKIINAAKYTQLLSIHLAGIHDLMAADG